MSPDIELLVYVCEDCGNDTFAAYYNRATGSTTTQCGECGGVDTVCVSEP